MNKKGWLPRLRYMLLGGLALSLLVMCFLWDSAYALTTLLDEGNDAEFIEWCLSGCNKTLVSYANVTDNLWGIADPTLYYIERHTASAENATLYWTIPLNYTAVRLIPESLVMSIVITSQSGTPAGGMIISPDNLTWYDTTYEVTNTSLMNVLGRSNVTQDRLVDFVNSSGWFRIYIKANTTQPTEGIEFRAIRLQGDLYDLNDNQITNCSNPYHSKALSIYLRDETSVTAVAGYFENIQFDYTLQNGTSRSQAVYRKSANDTHFICVYNFTNGVIADMQAVYTAEDYSQRNWYLVDDVIFPRNEKIYMYLVNDTLDDQVAIQIRDENYNNKEDVEVRVLRWMPPAYNAATILKTNSEGKAFVYVDLDEWYKIQVLYEDTLYFTSNPTQFVGKDTTSNPHIVDVTFGTALPYIEYISGIAYSGIWNSGTEIYTLTVADTTGSMASGHITTQQLNLTGEATICWQNSTSASFTITCDLSAQPNGTYAITAWLTMDDGTDFIVNSTLIYIGSAITQLTNYDGLILSIILIGTAGMVGVIHPALMVLLTVIGLVAAAALQIALIGMEVVIPIVFIGIIIIYLVRK